LKVPTPAADSDDEVFVKETKTPNEVRAFEDADDYADEVNEDGFYPLPHNPTQRSHMHVDHDNDTPFMDAVALRLHEAAGSLPYPSVLREFGGSGNCGPAALSGMMNFFRIDGNGESISGGPLQLRRFIVDRARERPDVLDDTFLDNWRASFPDGIEVRESTGLRVIYTIDDYLDHMRLEGSHFDDPAWQIAARVLNLTIVIHRVSSSNLCFIRYHF
jgi:hypothetical protein